MAKMKINKTNFILSLPFETPAREILSAAKAKGIKFKEAYVYRVRNLAKQRGPGPASAPAPSVTREGSPKSGKNPSASKPSVSKPSASKRTAFKPSASKTKSRPADPAASASRAFRALVVSLGVARSRAIVAEVEAGLRRLLGL